MKPIYFACLFLLLLVITQPAQAQVHIPIQLQQRLQGKNKLKDIMREVDAYYKTNQQEERENNINGREEESDDDYAKWKRWEWYMSSRLAPDGSFVNLSQIYLDAFNDRMREENSFRASNPPGINGVTTAGAWAFVGPNSYGTVWGSLPGNGRVDRIGFDPNNAAILYAATPAGGVWKSVDYGSTWVNLSNYPASLGVSGIVVDKSNSNTIYILTGDGDSGTGGYVLNFGFARQSLGILKSIDGGMNWQQTGAIPVAPGTIYYGYYLSQSGANTNILIAATSVGLFRTTDGGVSWNHIASIPGSMNDVKFNPRNGNTVFAAGANAFYYSNDAGANWSAASFNINILGANRIQIGIGQFDTSKVYALCGPVTSTPGFYGLYSSVNGGKNFTRVSNTPNILGNSDIGQDVVDQSIYDLGICVNPFAANTIFTCGTTIWSSGDGGVNFTHKTLYWGGPGSNAVHPDIHSLEVNPVSGNIYACTDGGLYVSNVSGTTWTYLSDGINSTQWYHMVAANRTHLLGGLQDNGIRNRTTATSAFNHVTSGDGFSAAYDPNDGSRFMATVNSSVLKYSNDGANYISTYGVTANLPFIGRHPTNTNIVFVGREDSIFKSTDEGTTYTKINIGGNRRIVFAPSNPLIIYAANSSKVWRTNDGGNNWTDLTASTGYPSGSPVITCVAVNPVGANNVMVTFGGFDAAKKVIISTNGGATWTNDGSSSLPNLPVNCVVINSDNSSYIGTDVGVYYEPSGGTSWFPFYAGLPLVPVTDLVIFGGTDQNIYASTFGRGIWYGALYGACSSTLTLSGSVSGIQNFISGNITSTQAVTGGGSSVINYQSGVITILSPGFIAPNGTSFYAKIGPCNDVPGRPAGTNNSTIAPVQGHNPALLNSDSSTLQRNSVNPVKQQ